MIKGLKVSEREAEKQGQRKEYTESAFSTEGGINLEANSIFQSYLVCWCRPWLQIADDLHAFM